jgi:hypothetical protein
MWKPSPARNWTPTLKSCTTISEFEELGIRWNAPVTGAINNRRKAMKGLLSCTAISIALAASSAQAQQTTVKIGVMSDMSSLYSDIGGAGSTAAAKLAIADFIKSNPNVKVDLVSADHQNKADVGTGIVNKWYDTENVDLVIDVPNSGVALAISQIALPRTKFSSSPARRRPISPVRSAMPTPCTGPMTPGCSPTAPARRW